MKKVPQIQKTDFEKQKDKLKEFSEQTSLNPEFETYKTNGGLFGWFDHTITGNEMNEFVRTLQKYVSENDDAIKKLIKEFGEVYETFDSLDNEYIKGILLSIEATEKVSKDNAETIQILQEAVQKLKEIKEENEKYHKYIDSIGNDIKALNEFNNKATQIEFQLKKLEKHNKRLNRLLLISILVGGLACLVAIIAIVLSFVS